MKFDNLIDDMRDEIISEVQNIIRIKSTDAESVGNMPFGEGIHKALMYALELSERLGFRSTNLDNYVGFADYLDKKEMVGVLGHLDVVPEGDDWTYPPYGAEIHNGKIYGRGTADDKGPTIAALYAMKAIKDSGLPLSKMIRIIYGTNEESSWKGIAYYKKRERMPDMSFTPDAEFPLIHGEKGMIRLKATRLFDKAEGGYRLLSLKGGSVVNAVPESAEAVIYGDSFIDNLIKAYDGAGVSFDTKVEGEKITVKAHGKAAHASLPHLGRNAISELMLLIDTLPLDSNAKLLGEVFRKNVGRSVNGEDMGIFFEDAESGKLTFNVGIIKYDGERLNLYIDMRYPVTDKLDRIVKGINERLTPFGIKSEVESHEIPIYTEKDHPLVKELVEVYRDYTGDMTSEPKVIGGGTYAKAMKNSVAFGPLFPGEEELAHQRDECIDIENLILMTKIYASALYRLAR